MEASCASSRRVTRKRFAPPDPRLPGVGWRGDVAGSLHAQRGPCCPGPLGLPGPPAACPAPRRRHNPSRRNSGTPPPSALRQSRRPPPPSHALFGAEAAGPAPPWRLRGAFPAGSASPCRLDRRHRPSQAQPDCRMPRPPALQQRASGGGGGGHCGSPPGEARRSGYADKGSRDDDARGIASKSR